jgi:hypothetical protein
LLRIWSNVTTARKRTWLINCSIRAKNGSRGRSYYSPAWGKEAKSETVVPHVSQETLAEMVGTTRSRVNFFMNKFRKLGFIDYNCYQKFLEPLDIASE